MHKCNSYCKKVARRRGKANVSYCRFKFPRQETTEFKLNNVAKSIAARKTPSKIRLYDIPRKASETRINDYNPQCLYVARCNIDLQFVNEASSAVCDYICKYQTKAEKTGLNIKFANSSKSTSSILWTLALSGMQNRDVGSVEAADSLLGHWQTKTDSSTVIKWMDTSEDKKRMLKTRSELEMDEKSTDIWKIDTVNERLLLSLYVLYYCMYYYFIMVTVCVDC